jgi:hypothetical protein
MITVSLVADITNDYYKPTECITEIRLVYNANPPSTAVLSVDNAKMPP